jgi:copper chaperone NosL
MSSVSNELHSAQAMHAGEGMKSPLLRFYDFLDRPLIMKSRLPLALLVVPLVLSLFSPLWRISMEAPQYPDGLALTIYAHTLEGDREGRDLQEINTLNHYIGMKRLDRSEFADLDWIPFAIGLLCILTLRVAAVGNVRALIDLAVTVTYVLGFMGARFVYKLYVFGHELDPQAPMDVEPFTPAIIGSKQIANFTTHSMPQSGSYWLLAFATGVLVLTVVHLWVGRRAAARESLDAGVRPLATA